jgi:hypothetical protein
MSLKNLMSPNAKKVGTNFPPILKLNLEKGSEFVGIFRDSRSFTKTEGIGKKAVEKEQFALTFEAVAGEKVDVVKGELYTVFASGHLKHLLTEVIATPDAYKGKKMRIEFLGKEKMNKGAWAGKEANRFALEIDE